MRTILHETMTGEPVTELDFSDVTWSSRVCGADEVSVQIPDTGGKSMWPFLVPRKYTISVSEDNGVVRAAGMLKIPEGDTDRDGVHHIIMPGSGPESLYERRKVLPVGYWPLVDAKGYPITARDTRFTGVDYGTMMKRLLQQAQATRAGNSPPCSSPTVPAPTTSSGRPSKARACRTRSMTSRCSRAASNGIGYRSSTSATASATRS